MPRSKVDCAALLALQAGCESIAIRLERDRHKSIRLRVKPDGTVLARAPHGVRQEDVLNWLATRAGWILERQAYFERLRAALPEPGYGPGAMQRFLGQEYALHISGHVRGSVRLDENGFHIQTRGEPGPAKVRALLDRWFHNQAAALFAQRLAVWFPVLRAHAGVTLPDNPPLLKVRAMRSRYGSCSQRGVITLNRHLIATPPDCIDYVLVHELCHLLHFGHGRDFYGLLEAILPDWRERKARLREYWQAHYQLIIGN